MRTTGTQFITLVRTHIIDRLEEEETTELKEQLQIVMNDFNNWYCPCEKKRTPNIQMAFKHWLLGLPSSLSFEYSHYNISQTLKSWFEECGEKYKETEGSKESDLYYHLVVREFFKLYNKHCK